MKIRFLGAVDGHVTGSCAHFHFERTNVQFLVDCGLKQGEGPYGLTNGEPFPFEPSEIDFVLLTHAHQDHCGQIPKLYREGFTGEVICTSATAALALANLKDSLNHIGNLFSQEDVAKVRFSAVEERSNFGLSRLIPIHDHLFVAFTRSAHILGSCSIVLGWQERDQERRTLVMSGDLGNNTKLNPYQPILAGRQGVFGYPDYIVIESTYGSRVREPSLSSFEQRARELRAVLEKTASHGGVLLVPAFSMHRTQEILVDLYTLLNSEPECAFGNGIDVVVDSRLACAMTKIYRRELSRRQLHKSNETLYRNRLLPARFGVEGEEAVDSILDDLFDTSHLAERPIQIGKHTVSYRVGFSLNLAKSDFNGRGTVLLTGGGMCEGGPVVEHLKVCLAGFPRPVTLLVTGYMANDSLGSRVVQALTARLSEDKPIGKVLEVGDIKIPIEELSAEICALQGNYSGHADQAGLLDFIFTVAGASPSLPANPVSVFINHGQHAARKALEVAIRSHEVQDNERHIKDIYLPDSDAWFNLDDGCWTVPEEISGVERQLQALLAEQRKTNALLKQLIALQAVPKSLPAKKRPKT